jgi:hypothetical protein
MGERVCGSGFLVYLENEQLFKKTLSCGQPACCHFFIHRLILKVGSRIDQPLNDDFGDEPEHAKRQADKNNKCSKFSGF